MLYFSAMLWTKLLTELHQMNRFLKIYNNIVSDCGSHSIITSLQPTLTFAERNPCWNLHEAHIASHARRQCWFGPLYLVLKSSIVCCPCNGHHEKLMTQAQLLYISFGHIYSLRWSYLQCCFLISHISCCFCTALSTELFWYWTWGVPFNMCRQCCTSE